MKIIRDLRDFQAEKNMAVSIGNFDGVHLGHQEIIRRVVSISKDRNFESAIVTFDPHPMKFFGADVKLLQTTPMKLAEIEKLGVDKVFLLEFTKEMAGINPTVFVRELLLKKMKARFVVVGYDYKFGRNRRGTYDFLRVMAEKHGFTALQVPKVDVENVTASSTNIRKSLETGDPGFAAKLLGRNYSIRGVVERGDGLATKIGFPTANIKTENELIPRNGIYSSRVHVKGKIYNGALYIGDRPTVTDAGNKRIEVHLFDFSSNLYGAEVEIEIEDFIRGDKKFDSVEELVAQIDKDCKQIKVLFDSKQ